MIGEFNNYYILVIHGIMMTARPTAVKIGKKRGRPAKAIVTTDGTADRSTYSSLRKITHQSPPIIYYIHLILIHTFDYLLLLILLLQL